MPQCKIKRFTLRRTIARENDRRCSTYREYSIKTKSKRRLINGPRKIISLETPMVQASSMALESVGWDIGNIF